VLIEIPAEGPIILKREEDLYKNATELLSKVIDNKDFYPDIKFKIGNTKIFAHKAILYNCSSIWRRKFEGDSSRPTEPKKEKR